MTTKRKMYHVMTDFGTFKSAKIKCLKKFRRKTDARLYMLCEAPKWGWIEHKI